MKRRWLGELQRVYAMLREGPKRWQAAARHARIAAKLLATAPGDVLAEAPSAGVPRWIACENAADQIAVLHVEEHYVGALEPAPLALLLPFTSAHVRQLRPLADALAKRGVSSVAIDPPGHGRSGGERGVFEIHSLLNSICLAAAQYANWRPAARIVLIGSSWGGDLALLAALWEQQRPPAERVIRGVVGQAVITPWQRELFSSFLRGMNWVLGNDLPAGLTRASDWIRRTVGSRLPVSVMFRLTDVYADPDCRQRYQVDPLVLKDYDLDSYLGYLRYEPAVDFAALTAPILLLHGANDRLVPLSYFENLSQKLAEANPRTRAVVIPGGSHALFEEHAAAAAAVIADWLSATSIPTGSPQANEPRIP